MVLGVWFGAEQLVGCVVDAVGRIRYHEKRTRAFAARQRRLGLQRRLRHGPRAVERAVRIAFLRLVAEDDLVVCHNRWSGTYHGTTFRGVRTPDAARFSVEHIHIYRITKGRIREHWVVRDDLSMMRQLGAVPGS